MLVVCRLAGLSAREAHYARLVAPTQTSRLPIRVEAKRIAFRK
jgi:hypothetical protein